MLAARVIFLLDAALKRKTLEDLETGKMQQRAEGR